jgi:hypothetical protein
MAQTALDLLAKINWEEKARHRLPRPCHDARGIMRENQFSAEPLPEKGENHGYGSSS